MSKEIPKQTDVLSDPLIYKAPVPNMEDGMTGAELLHSAGQVLRYGGAVVALAVTGNFLMDNAFDSTPANAETPVSHVSHAEIQPAPVPGETLHLEAPQAGN